MNILHKLWNEYVGPVAVGVFFAHPLFIVLTLVLFAFLLSLLFFSSY